MRITFLLQDTGTIYGAERATLDLASGLRRMGDVDVSATVIHESRLEVQDHGLHHAFQAAGIPVTSFSTQWPFSWALVKAIREHVVAQKIDCVHAVGYKAAVHGGLAVRFGRVCPWVSTVHGWLERPDLKERFYGWLEIQTLKRAQRVIVLSNFYRDKLAGRGIPADRLAWIPSGIALDSLSVDVDRNPFSQTVAPPTIGILGRLSLEKNHAMFLRVAHRLVQDGYQARFLIAGDGPERSAVERLVQKLGLEAHVVVAGVMDRDDFFRQIDLLVLCSRIENLPYVILESMAWSRPVVATRVGGVSDLVTPNVTGLLVEDQDTDGMVLAIESLMADPKVARAMGAAGRRRLESDFTLQRSAESHAHMYKQLVAGGDQHREAMIRLKRDHHG